MSEYKNVWCVAEQRRGKVVPVVYELITVGRQVASELGQELCLVLMGKNVGTEAENLTKSGVDKVYLLENDAFENFVDDLQARMLADHILKEKPNKVFLTSSTIGRSLAARTAVLVKTGLAAEVTAITLNKEGGYLNMRRPCCGGTQMISCYCKTVRPEMATIRPGAYSAAPKDAGKRGEIIKVPVDTSSVKTQTTFKGYEPQKDDMIDVGQASSVVSGGYGLGGADGFKNLTVLAKKLGGAVAASRRAVDLGWIPYRHQVGLTGRSIKPKLYIACGISGQIQHLAGMSQAETIVAINTDPQAPMMKLADYAVEGDLNEIIPALIEELK